MPSWIAYLFNSLSCKAFRPCDYPSCKIVWWIPFCSLYFMTKNTMICRIKPIPMHPCFIRINAIVITNTVIITLNISKQVWMVKVLPRNNKTWQNLTDIDTCENIRLIQACIYHGYYKIFSKGKWITAIHHSLLS